MNKDTHLRDLMVRFRLTQRETDVLKRLLEGLKNSDIAVNLAIAEQTVKDHLSRIYKKIGVKNRFELMRALVKSSGKKTRSIISAPLHVEEGPGGASLTDELTGTYNRKGFLALVEQQMKIARRQKKSVCMLYAEVERGKTVGTSESADGDALLKDAAAFLRNTFRESDVIARIGGDAFMVIPLGATEAEADRVVARLKKNLEIFNSKKNGEEALSINYGTSHYDPAVPHPAEEFLPLPEGERNEQ